MKFRESKITTGGPIRVGQLRIIHRPDYYKVLVRVERKQSLIWRAKILTIFFHTEGRIILGDSRTFLSEYFL